MCSNSPTPDQAAGVAWVLRCALPSAFRHRGHEKWRNRLRQAASIWLTAVAGLMMFFLADGKSLFRAVFGIRAAGAAELSLLDPVIQPTQSPTATQPAAPSGDSTIRILEFESAVQATQPPVAPSGDSTIYLLSVDPAVQATQPPAALWGDSTLRLLDIGVAFQEPLPPPPSPASAARPGEVNPPVLGLPPSVPTLALPSVPSPGYLQQPSELFRLPLDAPLGYTGPSGIVPRENQESSDFVPLEDRWRSGFPEWDRYDKGHPPLDDYPYAEGRILNPYTQNVLKGDYPIIGQHTFLNITAESETIVQTRQVPTPQNGFDSTTFPGGSEFFGNPNQICAAAVFPTIVRPVSRRRGIQADRLANQAAAGVQHELLGRAGIGRRQPECRTRPNSLPRCLGPRAMVLRNEAGRS